MKIPKPRKQRKPRSAIAKVMQERFVPKIFPAKRGKGSVYNRKEVQKDRGDHSGPYLLGHEELGLEPRILEPKTKVLPLHHSSTVKSLFETLLTKSYFSLL